MRGVYVPVFLVSQQFLMLDFSFRSTDGSGNASFTFSNRYGLFCWFIDKFNKLLPELFLLFFTFISYVLSYNFLHYSQHSSYPSFSITSHFLRYRNPETTKIISSESNITAVYVDSISKFSFILN